MRLHGINQALLALAHYVLLLWMAQAGNLLLVSVLRLFACAAFGLLLFFVIGRSANFLKTIAGCLCVLPSSLIASSVNKRWTRRPPTLLILPEPPLRRLLFQRPPPLFSL